MASSAKLEHDGKYLHGIGAITPNRRLCPADSRYHRITKIIPILVIFCIMFFVLSHYFNGLAYHALCFFLRVFLV